MVGNIFSLFAYNFLPAIFTLCPSSSKLGEINQLIASFNVFTVPSCQFIVDEVIISYNGVLVMSDGHTDLQKLA